MITDEQLRTVCGTLSLEEKVLLLTGRDSWSTHPLERIGLRSMVLSDGPVGVRGATWDERDPSANFPSPTALAASWDRDLVHRVGNALGCEAVRKNVDVLLAPTINLQRAPYAGRHFEAFSEDPLLTSELATQYVAGVQEYGVGATVKHYVANDSETDRFTVDVQVTDRVLRELYLRAFEGPVVDGGAWLVMSAYNSVNGARATESELLRTPLQTEWGFDGTVVSDWTAVRSIESAKYPQDLAMPGPGGPWGQALVDAVRAGQVAEEVVDEKVVRLLRLASRVGALAGAPARATAEPVDAVEVAKAAAVAGAVLLHNDGILPLQAPPSIAVIGEGAVRARTQGGGSATVIPASVISPLDGIRTRWPEAQVTWSLGAVVQKGLADLPEGSFTTPDGAAGMHVRYLDHAGNVTAREDRRASGIVSFDAASLASNSAVVEMQLNYAPAGEGATFPFGVAGLCDYEVLVDGVSAAAGSLRTGPGDDPAAAVLHPPATSFELPRTDDIVQLVVRLSPVAGEMPDALALRLGVPAPTDAAEDLIANAATAAAAADVAVVVVSTSSEVESEGFDRDSLALPGHQDALVRAVSAANPRTVVVINTGSPVVAPWLDDVAAALTVWFPGQEAGTALAEVLSGDSEPGGRLPVTWPASEDTVPVREVAPTAGVLAYEEGLHIGYRAYLKHDVAPAFAFGHGLGYTTWQVSDLEASPAAAPFADIPISVTLENTGARDGKAVVQVYAERVSASGIDRPARWLATFDAFTVDAGGSRRVRLEVPGGAFAHWSAAGWAVEPGEFQLVVGLASDDARQVTSILVG